MADVAAAVGHAVRRLRREVRVRRAPVRRSRPDAAWQTARPWLPATDWWSVERRRVAALLDGALGAGVGIEGEVAVVCVTNRPGQSEHVCRTIAAQRGVGRLRVVVVLNDSAGDARPFEEQLGETCELTVVHVPPPVSLGECLNTGWGLAGRRFVAKIDDDDSYGPHYLRDAVRVLRWSPAAVVGKHSYLASMTASGVSVLRFPGHEWEYTGFVAGGTIVADMSRTGGARFGDSTTGEDSAFLAAVEREGGLILSTSVLDFVQLRSGANTWQIDDEAFARDAVRLGPDDLAALVSGDDPSLSASDLTLPP